MSYTKDTYLHTHKLSYSVLNTKIDFRNLNFSLSAQKYDLVGNNGCGKSTLLKILAKQLLSNSGQIYYNYSLIYISQKIDENLTFAEVFEIDGIIKALDRISQGSTSKEDFELSEDNWTIKAEFEDKIYKLSNIKLDLNNTVKSISGVQFTQVLLAKVKLSRADIILLDEPTNNLDSDAKADFIDWLATTDKCIVIASHDRQLLNQMNSIIEIDNNKLSFYTGKSTLLKLISDTQAYSTLARYKFRNIIANRRIKNLSRGEKIRASLAVCLNAQESPQLEPTNHLDIESISLLESALNCYTHRITRLTFLEKYKYW